MTRAELLQIAKPILFNTEMVRAILDGKKTVTRRKIDIDIANQFDVEHDGKTVVGYINPETGDCYSPTEIYKYQPGNILYVRETWSEWTGGYLYRAWPDGIAQPGSFPGERWRPSIHMPREAARIFLRVTDVRVERLRDITEEQAIKEGFDGEPCTCVNAGQYGCTDCMGTGWIEPPQVGFIETWNSTIKKSDLARYGWDANPWVWVIEFERVKAE